MAVAVTPIAGLALRVSDGDDFDLVSKYSVDDAERKSVDDSKTKSTPQLWISGRIINDRSVRQIKSAEKSVGGAGILFSIPVERLFEVLFSTRR